MFKTTRFMLGACAVAGSPIPKEPVAPQPAPPRAPAAQGGPGGWQQWATTAD